MKHKINSNNFKLLADKTLFWEEKKTLILADLHLGKAGHFRHFGIPLTSEIDKKTLSRISTLIEEHNPEKILILGDLFHSKYNDDHQLFKNWRETVEQEIILCMGNHDKYSKNFLETYNLNIVDFYEINEFCFSHNNIKTSKYNIYGHIHPAIVMKGEGGQKEKLEAFVFSESSAIIPAFGEFTGTKVVYPAKNDKVYAVCDKKILEIN